MIVLGVILLILGILFGISILTYIGVVLIVIGAVLWILGATGRAGRRSKILVLANLTTPSRRSGRPRTGPRSSSPARSPATRELFLGRPIWLRRVGRCAASSSTGRRRRAPSVAHRLRRGAVQLEGDADPDLHVLPLRLADLTLRGARADARDHGPGCGSDPIRPARSRGGSRSTRPARSAASGASATTRSAPASSRVLMPTRSSTRSASLLGKCR